VPQLAPLQVQAWVTSLQVCSQVQPGWVGSLHDEGVQSHCNDPAGQQVCEPEHDWANTLLPMNSDTIIKIKAVIKIPISRFIV